METWTEVLGRVRQMLADADLDVSEFDENVGYSEPGIALSDAITDLTDANVKIPGDLRNAITALVAGTSIEREVLADLATTAAA